MRPIIRSPQAKADVAEILSNLEERSRGAAKRLAQAIQKRCEVLRKVPMMGRARDDLAPGLRSIVIEKYVLFYRVTSDAIEVVRVLHGARDIESIMKSNYDS